MKRKLKTITTRREKEKKNRNTETPQEKLYYRLM